MKRRRLLQVGAAGALVAGGLAWLRPADRSAPHTSYFSRLQRMLQHDGPGTACLVLDLDRVNHNLIALRDTMPPKMAYRVVAKSLPCTDLIQQVLATMHSRRIMSFHQPFTNQLAQDFPDADLLLGKPMPVDAAAAFYDRLRPSIFDPQMQLQWLIDTPDRLRAYRDLARQLDVRMRINIEIDVGLRRGGVSDDASFIQLLRLLRDNSRHLRFAGLMGYDAHVMRMPAVFGSPESLQQEANARYAHFLALLRQYGSDLLTMNQDLPLVFNTAGSLNYQLHATASPANEVAVGSALVKPSDFDIDSLDAFQSALYIAAPVLKTASGLRLPGMEWANHVAPLLNPNLAHTHFIYGGNWMATPESPAGLRPNRWYGRSSNQEMLNGGDAARLRAGDYVFFRPTQSEAVMLQFGPLVVVQAGTIIDRWPVLSAR
ncbi:alanine racemase [Algiphilus sp.]|uniref:alanine racemase n=1 Tax=Algiphilus sp. TaxID=1872431 RepID=UPI002A65FEE7|nr:alanine racemase [Pseudomonadota bacterium]